MTKNDVGWSHFRGNVVEFVGYENVVNHGLMPVVEAFRCDFKVQTIEGLLSCVVVLRGPYLPTQSGSLRDLRA